jgi:hypothetical protein
MPPMDKFETIDLLIERANGHIGKLNDRVARLERLVYMGVGGLIVFQFIIGLLVAVYLKIK